VGLFAYVLENVARPTAAALSAHVRYLRGLGDVFVVGGPFRDGSGAIVCVTADHEAEAEAIARADPLVVFGFTLYYVHEIDRVEPSPRSAVAS
jgi:uncharacterized protein YciI